MKLSLIFPNSNLETFFLCSNSSITFILSNIFCKTCAAVAQHGRANSKIDCFGA